MIERIGGLDDPTGKSDDEFLKIIVEIERQIKELARRMSAKELL